MGFVIWFKEGGSIRLIRGGGDATADHWACLVSSPDGPTTTYPTDFQVLESLHAAIQNGDRIEATGRSR